MVSLEALVSSSHKEVIPMDGIRTARARLTVSRLHVWQRALQQSH